MNSREYWAIRARKNKLKVIKRGEQGINDLKRLLKLNLKDVEKQIEDFYNKYGEDYGKQLSFQEFDKYKRNLRNNVKKYPKDVTLRKILKEDAPKYRIDRLRQFQTELQIQLAYITDKQIHGIKITLEDVALLANKQTAKMIKKIGITFDSLNNAKLKEIINTTWAGRNNWSERIWKDREIVGKKLTHILKTGVPQGESLQKMASQLKNVTHNSYNNAFRIIRTETSHIDGQVTLNGYKQAQEDLGIKYYIYDAFLDGKTSTICRDLNGTRIRIDKAEVGVNYPPMHPNCRSTTFLEI